MRHHPNCPVELVASYADIISTREGDVPLTLGHAFSLTADNHVRHELTDYDRLLGIHGLTQEEARIIVSFEVTSILTVWGGIRNRAIRKRKLDAFEQYLLCFGIGNYCEFIAPIHDGI